ncbi:Oxysterol-binding protein 9 [Diplonema papillatum]|nr:Oxysterol-binding protein 9 [Diplonema papillatum]
MTEVSYPYAVDTGATVNGSGHNYNIPADQMKEERDAVWTFIKRLGANFLEGKDLVSIAMPVTMSEPASFLERTTRGWVTMPHYIKKIAEQETELEKMKFAVAMVVSGLHRNLSCKKPFNPVLGETFEASFSDGSGHIFSEQTSHHPPVSAWEAKAADGSWRYTGTARWSGYFAGNSVKGGQQGTNTLEFSSGYRVQWHLPNIQVSGVLSGNRVLDHVGVVEMTDNSVPPLKCSIAFGDQRSFLKWTADGGKWLAGALTGGWLGGGAPAAASTPEEKKVLAADEIAGEIYIAAASGNGEKMVLSKCSGSWLNGVDFSDSGKAKKRYWDRQKTIAVAIDTATPSKPLATDCRLRKDLVLLADGAVDSAQEAKENIENEQRRLAKLRK